MERNINQLPDSNPMPRFELFSARDVLIALGATAFNYLSFLPHRVLSPVSEHFQADRGAEAMLDSHLDGAQGQFDFDDMGNYTTNIDGRN